MKRLAVFLVLILVLSLVPTWAVRPVAADDNSQAYTMQLEPSDDSYVYEKYPDSNYGSRYYMWVGYYNGGYEYGYLKFNLSSIPWYANITSAKLCLYSMKEYNSPSISVHPVVSDDWNESAITWNNKPDYEVALDSVTVDGTGKYYCWDVTSFVKQQFSGDKVVSLALVPDAQDSAEFYTKEAYESNPHPYLNITYTAPPYVPIQEIQSNTTDGDKSAYAGQEVITRGVVTGVTSKGFFIQNGSGSWSGIYVYLGTSSGLHIGDYVEVLGTVQEFYGLTEIKTASENVTVLGTAEVPEPVVLRTGEVSQEQWESVLVKVENATVTNSDLGYGEWEVDDGSGPVRIDDLMYRYKGQDGEVFNYIIGVVYYSYGKFKIEPRSAEDLSLKIPEIVSLEIPRHYVGEGLINVTVKNNYEISTNVTLKVTANGDVIYLENLTLAGNEVRSVLVGWAPAEPGEYTVNATLMDREGKVFDTESADVSVSYGVGMTSYELPSVVLVEEPVELNFTLFNNYSTAKTVNFTVLVNGEPLYSNGSLTIGSGEEVRLSIPWNAPRYGNYTVNATLEYEGVIVARVDGKIYAQYGISPKESLELKPVADAYSYYYNGEDFSWKSYYLYKGTRYELAVGNSSRFSRERAYLRFDLSSIPENANITYAELCVYAFYVKAPMDVAAHEIGDSWSETNNPTEPALGALLDTVTMERGGRWYCWNATDYVIAEKSGDGLVSIALKMVNEDQDNIAWIASRENPSNKPYLRVNYSLPVEIKNFENVTVVVIGKANASAEGKDVTVKMDGGEYEFRASTQNVFVDALNFDPSEPSLLAYWKAVLTGYEVSKKSYVAEETLEKTVSVTEKRLTLHLAMGEPSMAVLVVPKLGDKVKSVTVVKDSGEFKLGENAVSSDLGYYYVTPTHVVIVLKKDPTTVIVTFQNFEVTTRPPAFDTFYKLSLHYMIYLKLHRDELELEYQKFENFTTELENYNVDLSTVPVSEIREEMQIYRNLTSQLPQNPVNLTAYKFRLYILFVQSRKAFLLHRELMKELSLWNPALEKAVMKARELAQQQANQTGETNQTANQTEIIIPPVTEEVKVLIDYSHNQYYVGQGIEELTTKIRENLGWEVTVSTEPLTYDLLKEYRVVILLNPKEDLSESEIEALQKYVENGGGLFIAGDWYKYVNLESLNAVVGKYGIRFNADELMDDDRNSGKRYYPYVGIYNREHPVMRYVPDTWIIHYNGDTLTVTGDAVWLIRAFDTGYAVDANGNVIQGKGSGPIVAAAVEVGDGRIVAYGSSRAFSDVYYGKYITSNWPFIRGALLWLAHQE